MTSVTVTFQDVWLTDVTNPSVSAKATSPDRDWDSGLDGVIRVYAGGRRRVIISAHRSRAFPLTLRWVGNEAQILLLESWTGRVLLLRDNLGRRVFGTFLHVAFSDDAVVGGIRHTAALTFTEVSYQEAT